MSKTETLFSILLSVHLVALALAINSVVTSDGSAFGQVATSAGRPKLNLDFGGDMPGKVIKFTVRKMKENVFHPEMVKSFICGTRSCDDCGDRSGCWHGDNINDVTKGRKTVGGLRVKVAPNSARGPTSYVAEVWARCSVDGGKWLVEHIKDFENGVLSIYVDDKLTQEVTSAQRLDPETKIEFKIEGDQHARIKLVFRADDPSKEAGVVVRLRAQDVEPQVEDCMSVKNCLDVLGKGGDAGFILRNNNKYQLTCLQGPESILPGEVQAQCILWKSCMTDLRKVKMMTFLKAGQGGKGGNRGKGGKGGKGSILFDDQARAASSEDPLQCVDPETDDPESWECECLPQMIERCGSFEDDECFRNLMCEDASICGNWKEEHCPHHSSLDERSILQNRSRSMMSQRSAVVSTVGMELDNALTGKCSE